jgi:putative copper export protein
VGDHVWTLVRFVHVLGAACWVGGMIVLGAAAFATIAVSGFALIDHRGIALSDLPDSDDGRRLLAKMGLLAAMGVVTVLHALWQGPQVRRAEEAGDLHAAGRWRALGLAVDVFLLVAALAALWLAVSLVP